MVTRHSEPGGAVTTGSASSGAHDGVDLVVTGDWVLTMDRYRTMIRNGAVAVRDGRIIDVGPAAEVSARVDAATTIGGPGRVVVPGFVNAHQHLTGDRLVRSTIPDTIDSDEAIFGWAVPLHEAHGPDDDELSSTCALVDAMLHGITFTVEAGTVGHPDRVLAAYDRVGVGGTLGSWGSDTAGLPWAGSVSEVIDRQRAVLSATAGHPRVHGWVTLVGHDLMSDELVSAASRLAADAGTSLTFHLSPNDNDAVAYLTRTGQRPVVHLGQELGALGPHVVIAHGVHLDDAELDVLVDTDTSIAYCPWAYLRLGQGASGAGRHAEFRRRGGRVAIGCDSENAGDSVDVLAAAALAVGLARDGDRGVVTAGAHAALELATIAGAEAIGMGHEIGSLEVGKRADVVVFDTTTPEWIPAAPDPVMSLVWGPGARGVSDVVASGRVAVADGCCVTVDSDELGARAAAAQARLLDAAGLDPRPVWPVR